MKLLFFKEEFYIDMHVGQGHTGYGIIKEGSNTVVFLNKSTSKFIVKEDPDFIKKINPLFTQEKIESEDDIFEQSVKHTRIKIIEETEDDTIADLIEAVKKFAKQEQMIIEKFLSYFPQEDD